ncbi:NUDIX domain-containing protein [Nicoliella spurrieriana]|uniref:Bis(5'-nucleosyl)-tetraphosphatase [asymmetrical] n=1 Tax=Nicoliella spurrieriana TaxID=2925830 RepID=A0A976RR77_9LACO|nr:NUDIX domain-containing protein [Nicoliella spurrieriana]UQS86303.1 NUDIX domain-containing protein [Nicoliella spurrieriana]
MKTELDGGAIVYRMVAGTPEYLLLKSATSDFWGFPKGHLEGSESYEDAAIRETKEETNLAIKLDLNFDHNLDYDMNNGHHKTVKFFAARVPEDAIVTRQVAEISNYGWFDFERARKQLTFDNLKALLDAANQYLTN